MRLRKIVLLNISLLLMGVVNSALTRTDIISQSAENFRSIAFDGFWSENSTNQAVYYQGKYKRTYTYWIDSFGDLVVGTIDHLTNEIETKVVCDYVKLKYSETTLSMLFTPEGKMLLFVIDANKPQQLILFTMNTAEDIRMWSKQIIVFQANSSGVNYAKALKLADDSHRIYFFTQCFDNEINYISSGDSGKSWSKPEIVNITKTKSERFFIATDNKSKIAFVINAYSDNKILLYNSENACNSVLELSKIPVNQNIFISDAAFDIKGQLITTSIDKSTSVSEKYFYNFYQKGKWFSAKLPVTNLKGGIMIDKENTTVVYYSEIADTVSELIKLSLSGGFHSKWNVEPITKSSPYVNFNVFPVLYANENNKLQLMWQSDISNDIKVNRIYSIKTNVEIPEINNTSDRTNIILLMKRVVEWQLSHPFIDKQKNDWHWGAFYTGLIAAYNSTGDDRFLNELYNVGQYYNWGFRDDIFHADRLLAADIYEFLYDKYKKPEMIEKAKWVFDVHLARVAQPDLSHYEDANYRQEWWSWCDALYMAPPSFYHLANILNEEKYREYAFKQWKITADYLYSTSDSLFYRDNRYFDMKSPNGKKVFWSRGNGWVIAALARILNYLPKDHPQREYYAKMYKEIAAKLLRLQMENGMWTVNLLDPNELYLGESSGTGFFGYALAWGINNNILDKKTYAEPVRRAWKALSANVNFAGRLGYVQQVAGSPFPFYENQSHVYASGAFLMFGAEVLKLQ